MLRPRKQTGLKRIVVSPLVAGVLAVFFIFSIRATRDALQKRREAADNFADASARLATFESRQAFLDEALHRFAGEEGVEAEIRKKFPVVKKGESMAIVVPDERGDEENIESDSSAASPLSRLVRFFSR